MEKASLDRWVNDPMIAETYNVVGFHYTGKPTNKQRQVLDLNFNKFYTYIHWMIKIKTHLERVQKRNIHDMFDAYFI